jgi:hypothetical protein
VELVVPKSIPKTRIGWLGSLSSLASGCNTAGRLIMAFLHEEPYELFLKESFIDMH